MLPLRVVLLAGWSRRQLPLLLLVLLLLMRVLTPVLVVVLVYV